MEGSNDTLTETEETKTILDAGEQAVATADHDHANDHDHNHEGHDHEHTDLEPGLHTHQHRQGPGLNPECVREISVEVPAEEVTAAFKAVIKRYQKLARLPGFRAGKVPDTVIRNRFMKDIRQEVLETLVSDKFRAAVEEQKLQPVSQPQVLDLHLHEGEPLVFKANFEIVPEFEIAGYESVTVEKPETELTDAEFTAEVDRMLESQATMEPVEEERAIADGDYVEISFTGKIVGEDEAEPLKSDHALVEVGGNDTVAAFNDALRGATVGQELTLDVDYPEDFGEKRLAGKTVSYELKVNGIKRKVLPVLDDAFVKSAGGYESLEAFNTQFREHLANRKKQRLETEAREKMVDAWVEKFQFPVPESLVQQQVDARLERGLRALAQQGMTSEAMRKLDFERLRAAQRETSIAEVKASLILDKIAKTENVELGEDEVERELLLVSLQTREPLDELKKRLTQDGGLNRIREQMLREKTGNAVYERLSSGNRA